MEITVDVAGGVVEFGVDFWPIFIAAFVGGEESATVPAGTLAAGVAANALFVPIELPIASLPATDG